MVVETFLTNINTNKKKRKVENYRVCLRESLLACVLLNNFARKPLKRTSSEGERRKERESDREG